MSNPVLTVVINPRAGRGKWSRVLPHVKAVFESSEIRAQYLVSSCAEHAEQLANTAARSGNTIVACGGDGHVGRLAKVASRYAVKFGIIPTGVGNDFAKEFSIKSDDIISVCNTLSDGKLIPVDLGKTNNHRFCSVAGVGFSSEANEWANSAKWLPSKLLYTASVLRTLAKYKPASVIITVDGKKVAMSVWLVAIANSRSFGGGMLIAPMASPVDGLLDVVVVGSVSRIDFLRTFPKVFSGTHITHPQITTYRGREICLQQPQSNAPLNVYADGERVGELPMKFTVGQGILRQLVPKDGSHGY